jgi:hypothetical protein
MGGARPDKERTPAQFSPTDIEVHQGGTRNP